MKRTTITVLLFVVLFAIGTGFISTRMPRDKASATASYSAETDVYVPPGAKEVKKFEPGGMALATVGMAGFKQLASSPGSRNFMSSAWLDGG